MKLVAIDFESATAEFQCRACNGSGMCHTPDADWCDDCGGPGSEQFYFGIFLANLAVASGMQLMFDLGRTAEWNWQNRNLSSEVQWHPNTEGRRAPGSEP